METIVLYILIFMTFMTLLVAFLPPESAGRVMLFVPAILKILPITAVLRALRGGKTDDDESK